MVDDTEIVIFIIQMMKTRHRKNMSSQGPMAVSSKSFFNFPTSASGGSVAKRRIFHEGPWQCWEREGKLVHANIAANVKNICLFSSISSSKSLHTSQIRLDALICCLGLSLMVV